MTELRFRLHLSRNEALRYYRGEATTVIVRAETGQTVSFPAHHIRPFVDAIGVNGLFKISFDNNNKLIGIKRLRH
ncbi:DUF2835 domain-containing protein [Methylophaga thiooxydans]|uniref:DUF2835 domain-containing protein n=1 Tax=Methylophaga thiooxydans TaxID=392484 RepID=UPI000567A1C7|nr:DUF2835 domain-containing protein [Methylophaga thiooxydans]